MFINRVLNRFTFSTITHIRGRSEYKTDDNVELRGIRIQSTTNDSPNLIFIPEIFDQAENWLRFFSNPDNKIIQQRNVFIVYPRNFGNSDRNDQMTWESHANDILRFMYNNQISMATLGGHGIGGKIALAAACYHFEKVTGYFGVDTTPTNQFYFEPYQYLRNYISSLRGVALNRPFTAISQELRSIVKCPKWRTILESNLIKQDNSYNWKFNLESIFQNIKHENPSSLLGWHSSVGLYPGRVNFTFPDNSRYVYLNTNTLPMLNVCPKARGFNEDIFSIQGDYGVQNHWVYEREDEINPYAWRISHFLKNYDGVHNLLQSRDYVGRTYVPDIARARTPQDDFSDDRRPAHYYHNWRFNNVYGKNNSN